MKIQLKQKDFLSIKELSKEKLLALMERARSYKQQPPGPLLAGKIIANCFFEPSTRTRLSFEAAVKRLGGEFIGFSEEKSLSIAKGETLSDTISVITSYADAIVIRHPLEGSARLAAEISARPVINGGDGANEHPTQTLLDLFSMQELYGNLDGVNIILAGDLKHSRTVHSLVMGLSHFKVRLYFVAPRGLEMPDHFCAYLRNSGIPFSFHATLEEVIARADLLYMTRLQKERFIGALTPREAPPFLSVNLALLESAKPHLKIFHPLPRLAEIDTAIDATPFAHYFQQSANGLYVRQALLTTLLNEGGL